MTERIFKLCKALRESKSAKAGSHWRYTGFWKDFFELLDLLDAEEKKGERAK